MLTVDALRRLLRDLPGQHKVWITLPNDEFSVGCVTQDRNSIHICKDNTEIPVAERVLYDERDGP